MRSSEISRTEPSVVRIPFSFDRYSLTATLSGQPSCALPAHRQGREAASRFLGVKPSVHLEVRCPSYHQVRTLCFDDGLYQGYRVDRSPLLQREDCPERDRFLAACRERLRAGAEAESAVPLSGPARIIISDLVEHSPRPERPSTADAPG